MSFHPETEAGQVVASTLSGLPVIPQGTEEVIDRLMVMRAGIADISAAKQRFIDAVLGAYKNKLLAFDDDIEELRCEADLLEAQVRKVALSESRSIKGKLGQVVYAKGRVSYDVKSLDAYAVANPQVLAFRKEGEPSVSIRAVGGAA